MTTVVNRYAVTAEGLTELRVPRQVLVVEVPAEAADCWEAAGGPFRRYERRLAVTGAGDSVEVVETITFSLAVPLWGPAVAYLYKRALRGGKDRSPWWFPPELLDVRAANALGLLCTLAIVGGFLQTLVTQTISFAADEFGAGRTAQGSTLAAVRAGTLIALAAGVLADRRGRRLLVLGTAATGCLFAGLGALAPNLTLLGLTQVVSRGSSGALMGLLAVVCAEEMPTRCRAWGFGLMTMAQALGAGMCVWVLPLADLGPRGWRLIYLVPLAGLPVVAMVARRMPESRRYERPHQDAPLRGHSRRLALLAGAGFLLAIWAAPVSQFQNDYLRTERGYSATTITLYTLCTSTPAGIGIVIGGRLAETHGRKWLLALGLLGGTVIATITYLVGGWGLWVWTIAGMIMAGLATAPLGAFRAEIFPTALRAKAGSIMDTVSLAGSAVGLVLVGWLIDRWDVFGRPMALVAIGPLIVVALVLAVFPETAGRTLEDLNPADRAPPPPEPPPPVIAADTGFRL